MRNYLVPALLIVAAAGLGYWSASAKQINKARREAQAKPQTDFVRIAAPREIAPGETLTTVWLPDSLTPDQPELARPCYLYKHAEYRTAQIVCPRDVYDGIEP